jgi:hypothetical protein
MMGPSTIVAAQVRREPHHAFFDGVIHDAQLRA